MIFVRAQQCGAHGLGTRQIDAQQIALVHCHIDIVTNIDASR
jgi:hypothetical protein